MKEEVLECENIKLDINCHECGEEEAVVRCFECSSSESGRQLCADCSATLHSLKKRKNHRLVTVVTDVTHTPHCPTFDRQSQSQQSQQSHASCDRLSVHDIEGYEEFELDVYKINNTVGIEIQAEGDAVVVRGFSQPHSKLADELSKNIRPGDVIVAIDNDRVLNVPYHDVIRRVRLASSPIHFHFIRGQASSPDALFKAWIKLDIARKQASAEHSLEIISLDHESGSYSIKVNDKNFERMFEETPYSEEKVPVISLLGNTTAGKSYLIRALMDEHETRPFCFEEDQMCSTTANANMYTTSNITNGKRINLIDFEGENGLSPFMSMLRGAKNLLHINSPETKQRHVAVKKYFPKIAYLLSDVIILVGDTSLVNKEYFTRCREFAEKANQGVNEAICRPSLLIVHNKCSLTVQFDMAATTREFMEAHIFDEYEVTFHEEGILGIEVLNSNQEETSNNITFNETTFCAVYKIMVDSVARNSSQRIDVGDLIIAINNETTENWSPDVVMECLETASRPLTVRFRPIRCHRTTDKDFLEYFADVKCIRVPRGDIRQNIRGKWHNGDEILQRQLGVIKETLGGMIRKQTEMRKEITVGERGWFYLLRSVVAQVRMGKPVSFGSLINALLSTGDRDVDRITEIFVRVYEQRSYRDFDWFRHCFEFAIELFQRMIGANMCRQADSSILTRETVSAQARKGLAGLLLSLKRFLPCSSIYPDGDNQNQYSCGQHRMFHSSNGHRTSYKVPRRRDTALNRILLGLGDAGRHEVWAGSFSSPSEMPTDYFELDNWQQSFTDATYHFISITSNRKSSFSCSSSPEKNVEERVSCSSSSTNKTNDPTSSLFVEENDELLAKLLHTYREKLNLQFKVFGDASMEHLPCIRCFRGCQVKDNTRSNSVKDRIMQLHSRFELVYLSPRHLAVCSNCHKFLIENELLNGAP